MQYIYMLDTNTVSFIIRGNENIRKKLQTIPVGTCCISAITEAELRYGIAKKPQAKQLALLVQELLVRLPSIAWDTYATQSYALIRASTEKNGITLGNMDMLIAAHAHASQCILITNDKTIMRCSAFLPIEDWTYN